MQKAYLILENGKVFEGTSFGAIGNALGELVFTTSMVGYNDLLRDAAYYGQIVVNTFPLIGNYGIVFDDFESKEPYLNGCIVREVCENPSNFNCKCTLESYMKLHGLVGICDIDTRELTKIIRDNGTMNCMIATDADNIEAKLAEIKAYKICDATAEVSCKEKANVAKGDICRVAVYDFGSADNLTDELAKRGCDITVVPYNTSCDEIMSLGVDGVILSDGPGNPADNADTAAQIAKLADNGMPLFGISLGHQILAMARGAKTSKLKYGHRGASQPVKAPDSNVTCITPQNHGYVVDGDSLPQGAKVSFVNVNDGSCEGIEYTDIKAFSVQFHPVTSGGPHDTNYLFDKFIAMCKEDK